MATLYVTELAALGYDAVGEGVMAPQIASLAEQAVPIGGSSAASQPFSSATRFVMLHADSACCIKAGPPGVVALAGFHRLAANETRFYSASSGQVVAVIASS